MLPIRLADPVEAAQLGAPAIFGRDAGSMNHIRRWMRHWPSSTSLVDTTDASSEVPASLIAEVSERVEAADWVLVGTGYGSFPVHAMKIGKDVGRPVIAVVDHWVNYEDRFRSLGTRHLPDALVITDTHAERLVRERLRWATPFLWPNEILSELRERISYLNPRGNSNVRVLLLGEPVGRSLAEAFRQPEAFLITRLEALLAELNLTMANCSIALRPHPSETRAKYVALLQAVGVAERVAISRPEERDITQDLAEADIAIGFSTYALYLMWAAGKPSFSLTDSFGILAPFPPDTVPQLRLVQ